ncbi:GGDEF domain-containing protein [Verticiella sediminum]|uniref:diguanylate cyclase n=1 Tax=Verticiella sediminum TaxID=1247510 RepID=A0A556A7X1_9BURK|nr:biofilm regulation diguanylate cyclase SiaD [Verticiella sediminum]TSH88975.1 GGDEF domain-containing protein [Verticiella sediminum]
MKQRRNALEARVEQLLADPEQAASPLGQTLEQVWDLLQDYLHRLERVTSLSDSYQSLVLERERGLHDRLDRQLRRVSRIVRISDKYQIMLREANNRLADSSNRDPLTDAPNRRALMERLRHECRRAARGETRVVVAMLDVDYFKQVNDQHGHDTGDRLLVAVAQSLGQELAATEILGRWGGEEFLMVLCDTDLAAARRRLQAKLDTVRLLRVGTDAGELSLTMSAGLTAHRVDEPISSTLERADAALYQAKHEGRDRIVIAA